MTIAGVASALPQHKYDQRVLLQALQKHWGPKVDNPVFLERLQARVGVETRHLALPIEEYYGLTRWGAANNHWIEVAQDLGQKALCCALSRSGFATEDLGALFFVSVTGISSPSIDARLVNRMSLPVNIKRVPIFGLGCVAGAAGISRAADYVLAYPKQVAAVLSVELCSLTLQQEDISIANIISSGLFGDGAAAVLVSGAERKADGPEILATKSIFYPNSEHVMGWDISEKGFRIVLSREVPEVVQEHLASDVDAFLEEQGLVAIGHRRLGAPHRRSARFGSHRGGARAPRRRACGVLGLSAQNRQSFVGLGFICARRSDDEAAARARHLQHPGRHGSRLLLRACVVEVVVCKRFQKQRTYSSSVADRPDWRRPSRRA